MLSRCRHHQHRFRASSTIASMAAAATAAAAAAIFLSYPARRERDHHHHDVQYSISRETIQQHNTSNNIMTASSLLLDSSYWLRSNNLTKCEAVNNKVIDTTVNNNTFAYNTPATIHDEEEESSSANGRINYYYKRMNPNDVDRTSLMESHAIFGPLWGEGLIERYHVYKRINTSNELPQSLRELTVVDLKVGKKLNGHDGIIHGGIISLLFDEAMGWAYECLQQQDQIDSTGMIIVTANLTVNFRAPFLAGSEAVIRVYHNETKGRKFYFSSRLESNDGSVVFAEASSLFVLVRKDKLRMK